MRGAVAKRLRREANRFAELNSFPERAYHATEHTSTRVLPNGKKVQVTTVTVSLNPLSARGLYKQMKKDYK